MLFTQVSRRLRGALLGSLAAAALAAPALAATAEEGTTFKIVISNVSKSDTLQVPGAAATKAPIAPGVFVVSSDPNPILAPGSPDGKNGLEALAEDGNSDGLLKALQAKYGDKAGMLAPGLEFEVKAKPGDRLSFATMFVQSNDKFYAPADGSVTLFDQAGEPMSGDLTSLVRLYDAGTEKDELPGAGPNQAPRQKAMNQGADEGANVRPADDGFTYPAVNSVIKVTITPAS
jgi:hypothetical protein